MGEGCKGSLGTIFPTGLTRLTVCDLCFCIFSNLSIMFTYSPHSEIEDGPDELNGILIPATEVAAVKIKAEMGSEMLATFSISP